MELSEHVKTIQSKADLIAFVEALCDDFRTNPMTWENPTLDQFLSALANWIADSDGYYVNQGFVPPSVPTWRHVADMLLAAKMYE